jgi:cellulose synthase/poly-beta-1,6-N-acetylglucosamine synthase-like glycosyltransferase
MIVVTWSRLRHRRVEKRYRQIPVSIVIAARNEEANISARIENLLAQEYPRAAPVFYLLALGQEMLALQDRILDLKGNKEMPARRLRLGVTELSALTWLPRLAVLVLGACAVGWIMYWAF